MLLSELIDNLELRLKANGDMEAHYLDVYKDYGVLTNYFHNIKLKQLELGDGSIILTLGEGALDFKEVVCN